ncbi:MAG: glycosyltransferase family 2 protein, partial [Clostridia bacterium]
MQGFMILRLAIRFLMWLSGIWLLFMIPDFKKTRTQGEEKEYPEVSIIIPARNEEKRLPALLRSLAAQKTVVREILVVDDASEDKTVKIAESFGCRVIRAGDLPEGWQGKSWACRQGALAAKGSVLLFLDADTWFENGGLSKLLDTYSKENTPLSVQPYHHMEKAYENLSGIFNIIVMMGTNLFTPLGRKCRPRAFFGPCQVISRQDYITAGGHESARGAILDDLAMGENFTGSNIPIRCMGGRGAVAFRMYPDGIPDIMGGWGKNFVTGAMSIGTLNMLLIIFWICGGFGASLYFFLNITDPVYVSMYLLFGAQIYWMLARIGNFSPLLVLFYSLLLLFFLAVFAKGLVMTLVFRKVRWKGRDIPVGKGGKK